MYTLQFAAGEVRFDADGRLWVVASRGDQGSTTFDLFDETLQYLGEVSLPVRIRRYALGAGFLVTPVVGDFDVPLVQVWLVK